MINNISIMGSDLMGSSIAIPFAIDVCSVYLNDPKEERQN